MMRTELKQPTAWVRLVWYPDPNANQRNISGKPTRRPVVNITARLAPQQYLD